MRRLKTNLIGVDQGNTGLFSDFESGGEMWTGHGPRESRKTVLFNGIFMTPPSVHVTISMWDMDQETNLRADLAAENITREGFEIVFRTWGDTRVARIRACWTAIGEMKNEDDWEVD
jgi:hypothetical protein